METACSIAGISTARALSACSAKPAASSAASPRTVLARSTRRLCNASNIDEVACATASILTLAIAWRQELHAPSDSCTSEAETSTPMTNLRIKLTDRRFMTGFQLLNLPNRYPSIFNSMSIYVRNF
ncbi:exported hypothetical protein [uncultured Pleomorphomonas sp.]|uniref:Uncharacterized protein n=1 Tax=uncultured Pleomorphomonas sp. TaxID=442121 RepID=A0A212L872_9HYPH|nr:exported hypothetical protein [uncultured Pleomorphomonas sp.]